MKLLAQISNIDANSAPGSDGIPPKFIYMAKVVLVFVLTKLYNKCFTEKCSPDDFKLSHVHPIPKTAAPKELSNFRTTSL